MPDGGAFVTGFKTSMTKAFNTCAEKEFKGDLIRKYLTGFISIKVKTPQFSNQAKTSLANPEARTAVAKFTTDAVKQFFTKYPNDLASIVKIIETEQKAEDAAQRAREAADKIKSGGKSLNALKDLPSKLADCNQFGGELFIVEGDSAGGSAKSARDPNTQAIMPIRGKILNTTTKDLAKILENREVRDIVTALGTGVGERFNIRNLRYDKIIIMTDADSDGGHIALLLCSLFLYHLPQLVLQNKLYKAVSPLYSVQRGTKLVYLYDDKELQEYIKKNGTPAHINRYKGLGEMDPKQLWETTMDPKTRKLQPLGTEDLEKTLELFDQLMGDDAKLRKAYIIENAEEGDL
jgi:DNA gyrase subunit B